MPMAKNKHEDSYLCCMLHLLGGHNALYLTATTVYQLAAVTYTFLEELITKQYAIQLLSTLGFGLHTLILHDCVSICVCVGISH